MTAEVMVGVAGGVIMQGFMGPEENFSFYSEQDESSGRF